MLQLSNGVIFPGFIIYLILYIIMRLMPDSFVRFQKHHAPMSFPIVNFSLPTKNFTVLILTMEFLCAKQAPFAAIT